MKEHDQKNKTKENKKTKQKETKQIMADNYDTELVEIKWSGDVIVLPRNKVDDWFHHKSFESKIEYVKKHPEIVRSKRKPPTVAGMTASGGK